MMLLWWDAARAYDWTEGLLFGWTCICAVAAFALALCLSQPKLKAKSLMRYALIALVWAVHFVVCYFTVLQILNALWLSSYAEHVTRAELQQARYAMIKAAGQMFLFSTWLLIALSFISRELVMKR
jgi:hypothetical protein